MVDKIVELEPKDYSVLKLIEECAELQEVTIKTLTKPKGALKKERLDHLIEELGDVSARLAIVAKHFNITKEVVERRQYKLNQTLEACQERYGKVNLYD